MFESPEEYRKRLITQNPCVICGKSSEYIVEKVERIHHINFLGELSHRYDLSISKVYYCLSCFKKEYKESEEE